METHYAEGERFVVHAYYTTYGIAKFYIEVKEYFFWIRPQAIRFARKAFRGPFCYKVKVWDQAEGPILANSSDAPALVIELI